MPKPIVGVTGPDRGGFAAWTATRFMVWRAGGRAVRITPSRPRDLASIDALVIGGGADVGLLPGEPSPETDAALRSRSRLHVSDVLLFPVILLMRVAFGKKQRATEQAARDELELALYEQARARRRPVLGICRGAQLINVARGGRLYRDLTGFYEESPAIRSVLPRKSIVVEDGTHLRAILGRRICRVNALHRQAIDADRLGSDLRVAAREKTGVVQAIEGGDREWFVLGVQWHPEYLPQRREQYRLFLTLVETAAVHRAAACRTPGSG